MISVTDMFCGAGGSGLGVTAVPGVKLVMASNHWKLAIETHAANFPDTDHDIADISQVNPRRYPRTVVLWASPSCTHHTQARGLARAKQGQQPDLFGETLPDEAAERSRATMWDVPRFAEYHNYRFVIVENVVEAMKWVLWPAWLQAMTCLGYEHKTVFLNSMHAAALATPRAPQSRDRLYVVFWKKGQKAPELEPRPLAWCAECEKNVNAIQSWKRPEYQWGRYKAQYVYRCPSVNCRRSIVEPYADPAANAIDWNKQGQRIGDRLRPLKPATMTRIQAGLLRYARPVTLEVGGNTYERPGSGYVRAWPIDEPMKTLCATSGRGVAVPPIVVPVEGREGKQAASVEKLLRTMTGRAETSLVVPYYGSTASAQSTDRAMPTMTAVDSVGVAFIAELRGGGSKKTVRSVREPLSTVTASGQHHMLVRNNSSKGAGGEMSTPASEPARTITTAAHQSLVGWQSEPPSIEDCTFRMLEPSEIGRAMAFRDSYEVRGNRREQVRQYGNAVTPPAAEWLIRAVLASIDEADVA